MKKQSPYGRRLAPKLPLYHGTTSKSIKRIDRDGLCTPKACLGKQVWDLGDVHSECRKNAIYVSPFKEMAEDYAIYAATEHGGKPVVYVIERWDKRCKLYEDPESDPDAEDSFQMAISGCKCIRPTRRYYAPRHLR